MNLNLLINSFYSKNMIAPGRQVQKETTGAQVSALSVIDSRAEPVLKSYGPVPQFREGRLHEALALLRRVVYDDEHPLVRSPDPAECNEIVGGLVFGPGGNAFQ